MSKKKGAARKAAMNKELAKAMEERKKKGNLITLGVMVLLLLVFALSGTIKGIKTEVGEDSFKVVAPMYEADITYQEIKDMQLREEYDFGKHMMGLIHLGMRTGGYKNKELGAYQCATYRRSPLVILVQRGTTNYMVFSEKTGEATKALYDDLYARWQAAKG